jgi:CHAT domain-containing protein/tetratricopeptide (TPR) repeat protein
LQCGRQRPHQAVALCLLLFWIAACELSCSRGESPQAAFARARKLFVRGDLNRSRQEAKNGSVRFAKSDPQWATRFRNLEAESLLWSGLYSEAISVLNSTPPPSQDRNSRILTLALRGAALARLRDFPEAERDLAEAGQLCKDNQNDEACGNAIVGLGLLAIERRQLARAEEFFTTSLEFARRHHDPFLEVNAFINLGALSLLEEHFDQAAEWSDAAYQAAKALGSADLAQNALGNLGWDYYKLGDSERALATLLDAEKRADQIGDLSDQASWLTDAGYIYMDAGNFSLAEQSFLHALDLERQVKSKEDIYNVLRVLARLSLQTENIEKANAYAQQALDIARQSGNRLDELYPMLVQGQAAARRGESQEAETAFRDVEEDERCPVSLKWEAQHSLARLYEDQQQFDHADREYRAALKTFEGARDRVRHEDSQLSFLTNAARIYDDYIHFLVERSKENEALRWADYYRARTLAEGLGLLSKTTLAEPPVLDAQAIARREKSSLLFYWLGEKRSYLWAIDPRATKLLFLPAGTQLNAAVRSYRDTLLGPQDLLESANREGLSLYDTLVAPAKTLLASTRRVVVIPDGSLNNLNFETLIVKDPKPHYWIEDVTITNASSLRLMDTSNVRKTKIDRNLLLVGNSVSPNAKYPVLARAAAQVESVAAHFPPSKRNLLTGEHATPVAYLDSNPERFSHIHFVAHGTASRLSPLDSAIILSNSGGQSDSFKLYAREIIRHPLRADLVIISACYGAGERAYSGEGLVGLSWAFLKAGAHNVIAALWEATDASTEQLMNRFYDELDKGATPDAALRTAKLFLLHDTNFRNPFYWAPFQLYVGSYRAGPGLADRSSSQLASSQSL